MSDLQIDELKIDKLANLAVKRGVGLQKGQKIVKITILVLEKIIKELKLL